MKLKIKILNFVLWLLNLTTDKTVLTKKQGKKFELFTFKCGYGTDEKTDKVFNQAKAFEALSGSISDYLYRNDLISYRHYKGKVFDHCDIEVTILKPIN